MFDYFPLCSIVLPISTDTGSKSLIPTFLYIPAMAEVFSLWMVATKSIFHKWTVDGKLSPSFVGQHIGLSSDPEKAVKYANNHMTKDQLVDVDDLVMLKTDFTAKGVALYCTTLADQPGSPTPMLRKICHKDFKNDEGKWHLHGDIPFKQKHDGESIVTILCGDLTSEEKKKLGKKAPESSSKRPHDADSPIEESPSKRPRAAEVEAKEQDWKPQKKGPLQDHEKKSLKSLILYTVVEKEWVEKHTHLLKKTPQDDHAQNNQKFMERYTAFLHTQRLELEEHKVCVKVCENGYERQRNQWSIELFEDKERAENSAWCKNNHFQREPQSYQVLAVEFSIPALAHALTECEQETAKFRTRLVRAYNRDPQNDLKTWYWNGATLPLVPLFQRENKFPLSAGAILEVSAWTESVIIQHE